MTKPIPPKVPLDPFTLDRLAGVVHHAMQEWSEGKSPHEHTRQVIFEEAVKLFYGRDVFNWVPIIREEP